MELDNKLQDKNMGIIGDWEYRLCDNINRKIIKKYGEDSNATDFPEKERVVVLVWTATGIIENGGFEYLFSSLLPCDSHYRSTLESFRIIGSSKAVDALSKAFALFPNELPPDDDSTRMSLYKTHSQEELKSINITFYNALDEITHCLAQFIIKNDLHIAWNEIAVM